MLHTRLSNPRFLDLRTIKTARTEKEINKAVQEGFFPLVKPVVASTQIKSKFCVYQHPQTGEIQVGGDFRTSPKNGFKEIIPYAHYYPHNFPTPFAAYLIPKDLQVGEQVWLEDLIEDIVGKSWNQGNVYRLDGWAGIWNGKDFEIDYDVKRDAEVSIG